MDASAFDESLGRALRLCRLAADLRLPIAEMLEHVAEAIEEALRFGGGAGELEALREIIATVGEVAAIGANLAGEAPGVPPQPPPAPPLERSFPLPANLREA